MRSNAAGAPFESLTALREIEGVACPTWDRLLCLFSHLIDDFQNLLFEG
jgi:hypothetical protein